MISNSRTRHLATAAVIFATASLNANAQYYGAGSTLQPSLQYQQMQQQAQAARARQSQQFYYAPMPQAPAQRPQSQFMAYPDNSLRSIGFPPVLVKPSPQVIDAIADRLPRCAAGAAFGHLGQPARSGPRGGLVGLVQGCSGF